MKPMVRAKTGILLEADVSNVFKASKKGLKPFIFSHGLMGEPQSYFGFAKDLASHGFLVLMPRHQDGSCCHATTKQGEELWYKKTPFFGKEEKVLRRK